MFITLGPLHIEKLFISLIGDWVKGSNGTDITNGAKSVRSEDLKVFIR